jgi:hypothetical protein
MLGSGLAAQLAALPSELDASFGRALPLLRDCCLSDAQVGDARRILLACSLTYLASAAVPALALWPFVGPRLTRVGLLGPLPVPPRARRVGPPAPGPHPAVRAASVARARPGAWRAAPAVAVRPAGQAQRAHRHQLLRGMVRPLVRGWLQVTGDY